MLGIRVNPVSARAPSVDRYLAGKSLNTISDALFCRAYSGKTFPNARLILTGIHAYLGVHVVERGVIFVDLSLAQIAALGATIAILMPITNSDPHAPAVYWIILVFTFIGALIFSMFRMKDSRIPQEAIIGICYAVASAAAILAMSKATSESEHLKDMLVGNILAVSWAEVLNTTLLYAAIGAFHYYYRDKFLKISLDPDRAEREG